jgi:hypothetical protein
MIVVSDPSHQQKRRRSHLRAVPADGEPPRPGPADSEPPKPDWWKALMLGLNVVAIAFVGWVGYERTGWRGAVFLVIVGVAVSYGYRHAAIAAGRVAARRGRKPSD